MKRHHRTAAVEAFTERVPGLNPLVRAFLYVLDPSNNPSSVVYGLVTVGAVIAAESARATDAAREIAATVVVIALYWCAHSYSVLLGRRLDQGVHISWSEAGRALTKEWAIMRGASIPVIGMLIAWALGHPIDVVEWTGLITVVVLLVLFEVAAGLRSKLGTGGIILQACLGIAIGCGIIAVRGLLA